jgi:uridine kinase
MKKPPYIIGISGGSASGKTFLLNQLMEHIPADKVTLISQDNYYRKLEDQKRDDEGLVNFDHPDAVDLDRLANDLQSLTNGQPVTLWEYTYNNPKAVSRQITYQPSPIILLEGLFIFYKPEVSRLLDLKVFVEAEEYIKLTRRIHRDLNDRGKSLDLILRTYRKYVAPMYSRFIAPYKDECDIIIPNNTHMYRGIEVLINHLRAIVTSGS